jgi:PPOX class probable F420-dependent enzyme
MEPMSANEVRAYMGTGSKTGKLATVKADGGPHVAPVWFTFDGEDIVFLTAVTTLKHRNMERDPRVSISVDTEEFPFDFARADGVVVSMDDERLLHWATETCRRYVGDDRAAAFGARNGVPGEHVVRVRVTKLVGQRNVAQ